MNTKDNRNSASNLVYMNTHFCSRVPCAQFEHGVSFFLGALLLTREKRLLAPSRLSVHPHVCRHVSAPTGRISMEFNTSGLTQIYIEKIQI
jgi:hypothetical protein